ncbi:MAG: hypothetical protein KDD70_09560 [Bdellovibrionales bacterium]|nr:hypothetical protein [Bdellovibrionales bacterium]
MNTLKMFVLCAFLALSAGCARHHGSSTPPGNHPPQGAQVAVNDPFAEATFEDGGNILLPQGWMDFAGYDGENHVAGEIKFQQYHGTNGADPLMFKYTLGVNQCVRFAPYAPFDPMRPGQLGLTEEELFDTDPNTNEMTWTVTFTSIEGWYVTTTIYLFPEDLDLFGHKYIRTLAGVSQSEFRTVYDAHSRLPVSGGGEVHHFRATSTGMEELDWVGSSAQPALLGGAPRWYRSQEVNGYGEFLLDPDPNWSVILVARNGIGRYSRPTLVRVGPERLPLVSFVPNSYATEGFQDIYVDSSSAGLQDFVVCEPPNGWTYQNLKVWIKDLQTGTEEEVPYSLGAALWNLPVPAPQEVLFFEAFAQARVLNPAGQLPNGEPLQDSERIRFRVIGR